MSNSSIAPVYERENFERNNVRSESESFRVIYLQQRFIATLLCAKKKKTEKKENRYSRRINLSGVL